MEDGSPLKRNGSLCHKAETPSGTTAKNLIDVVVGNFIGVVLKMVPSGCEENMKMFFISTDYIMMLF